MFTPSMTNEEIEAVAYKDFLEIRGRVEIAKDKFVQRVRCTPPGFWALHSLQETHTSHPVWVRGLKQLLLDYCERFYDRRTPCGCVE